VRADSLSGRHGTQDLKRLADADLGLLQIDSLPPSAKSVLRRHERQVRDKFRHRNFLDVKAQRGLASAAAYAFASRSNLIAVIVGVGSDKLAEVLRRIGLPSRRRLQQGQRFLMAATPVGVSR
jgi:succinoglycan biosynthesis protein ExoU